MPDAMTEERMSPALLRVVERARREPEGRFYSLAHLLDVPALERAFHRLRGDAAVGVDGVSKEDYGRELEANLADLHRRLKAKRYRHQPLRRVHLPKADGRTRPIGISAVEDKIVQGAIREVLEAVYEQDFAECSYGFRPGRSAHDAIRALNRALYQGKVSWILEADIESFFDSLDRTKLEEMLQIRVADGSLRRLIGKCVRVGVLEGEERTVPERGTAQGSGLSPLLGNVYLHNALDVWFEREVKPRLRGEAVLVRYCDDFVIGFERREDAQRVEKVLGKRMERFGLRLHPEKTRLIACERPDRGQRGGKGPGTFEFLGFTWHWQRSRRGRWQMRVKTRSKGLRRFVRTVSEWCRRHRHLPVQAQHAALRRRLTGHFQYFGVNGNYRSLARVVRATQRVWLKWLRRRSQRTRLTWERYRHLLARFPLPRPRLVVRIWGG